VAYWCTSFARTSIPAPGEDQPPRDRLGRGCGLDVFAPGIATIARVGVTGWSLDMLTINPEKVCYVIAKAHELEVEVAPEEPTGPAWAASSSPRRRPTLEQMRTFLAARSDDEPRELPTLSRLGRADFAADGWQEAVILARERPGAAYHRIPARDARPTTSRRPVPAGPLPRGVRERPDAGRAEPPVRAPRPAQGNQQPCQRVGPLRRGQRASSPPAFAGAQALGGITRGPPPASRYRRRRATGCPP
jgi:Protein of unknown function (DUF3775)